MSDGMAFLTGAAFAGVAVLFMMKGGNSLVANNLPPANQLPISQSNPYNPYLTTPPTPIPTVSSTPLFGAEQQLDNERLRAMLEQQRNETEQLKAQMQKQQLVIEQLTTQPEAAARNTWSRGASPVAAPPQQQENSVLTGVVWALGGMAITVSGGIVVVGALALLSRQQRPPRTTYVVQHPYNALPPTLSNRRRAEVMPPQLEERRIDYVEYDR